jgi:hypothetical protein
VEIEHLQDKLEKLLNKKEQESLLAGLFHIHRVEHQNDNKKTIRKEWNACGCLVVNSNAKDLTVRHLTTRHIETSDDDRLID